ncbi:MAG: hypothetical protein ACREIU_13980, partial [Planctomycetota bacterium]
PQPRPVRRARDGHGVERLGDAGALEPFLCRLRLYSTTGAAPVFAPLCPTILTPVPPGTQVSQTWDEKGNCDQQVDPGLYKVVVNTFPGGTCNLPLTISPCPSGSISSFGTGCGSGAACGGPATLTLGDCPVIGTTVPFRRRGSRSIARHLPALRRGRAGFGLAIPRARRDATGRRESRGNRPWKRGVT